MLDLNAGQHYYNVQPEIKTSHVAVDNFSPLTPPIVHRHIKNLQKHYQESQKEELIGRQYFKYMMHRATL